MRLWGKDNYMLLRDLISSQISCYLSSNSTSSENRTIELLSRESVGQAVQYPPDTTNKAMFISCFADKITWTSLCGSAWQYRIPQAHACKLALIGNREFSRSVFRKTWHLVCVRRVKISERVKLQKALCQQPEVTLSDSVTYKYKSLNCSTSHEFSWLF